jgi:hypothetical protein
LCVDSDLPGLLTDLVFEALLSVGIASRKSAGVGTPGLLIGLTARSLG